MRTIIDLSEEQVQRLGELCRREGVSRAEAVRRAVADYLNVHSTRERQDVFGIWREPAAGRPGVRTPVAARVAFEVRAVVDTNILPD